METLKIDKTKTAEQNVKTFVETLSDYTENDITGIIRDLPECVIQNAGDPFLRHAHALLLSRVFHNARRNANDEDEYDNVFSGLQEILSDRNATKSFLADLFCLGCGFFHAKGNHPVLLSFQPEAPFVSLAAARLSLMSEVSGELFCEIRFAMLVYKATIDAVNKDDIVITALISDE